MRTDFSLAQLADPAIAEVNSILRACVHCGFCTATCPTYVLTGDELDGPRGRIYLIKEMFEADRAACATDALHIDRCLSCLGCMTTCPSGVHYMHLVDHARAHVEKTWSRPLGERLVRRMLSRVLPFPGRFRLALAMARLVRPLARALPRRLRRMVSMAPRPLPFDGASRSAAMRPGVYPAMGERKYRVALLRGCVQNVLAPNIDQATLRLLARHGCEVVVPAASGCCGALNHHLGETGRAETLAKANIGSWGQEISGEGLDAIILNASGCGTMVKDYGYMFRTDPLWTERAGSVSGKARDISEFLTEIGLRGGADAAPLAVIYQAPCSLRHGQKVIAEPVMLLSQCGFEVSAAPEPNLCCGSAGSYNILQPGLADRLRARKVEGLNSVRADVVASGNIGCMAQLAPELEMPLVHVVELLDWATGGPEPTALRALETAKERK